MAASKIGRRGALGILLATPVAIGAGIVLLQRPGSGRDKLEKIVVGALSWPGIAPAFIGREKGFFAGEGVDLVIRFIESYDARRAALAANQIDIDHNTIDQLLLYRQSNVAAQAFAISDFSTGGDAIIARREITTLQALRGKSIAYAQASPSEFMLRYLLKQSGTNPADLQLKPVADVQTAGAALLAQQVDAAVLYEPWITRALRNERFSLLASTKEHRTLIPGVFIARASDLQRRSGTYAGFVRAWAASVAYFESHPEESLAAGAQGLGVSMGELRSVLKGLTIQNGQSNKALFASEKGDPAAKLVSEVQDAWIEAGFVTDRHDPEDYISHVASG